VTLAKTEPACGTTADNCAQDHAVTAVAIVANAWTSATARPVRVEDAEDADWHRRSDEHRP